MFFRKKENSTPARPYFVACDTPNRPLCIEKMSEAIQTSSKAKGAFVKMYIENFKIACRICLYRPATFLPCHHQAG